MTTRTRLVLDVATCQAHPLSDKVFGQLPADRFADLVRDIEERGIQYDPHVDTQHRVICGSQRLRALKALHEKHPDDPRWQQVEVVLRDDLQTEEAVEEHLLKDNLHRRHLTPGQQYAASRELERIYAAQAKQAQRDAGGTTPQRQEGDVDARKTSARVAADLGQSKTSYQRLKRVMESGDDDLKKAVDEGRVSISAAEKELRTRSRAKAQAPTDEGRSYVLRKMRFVQEVEKFRQVLDKNPRERFGPHIEDVDTVLDGLVAAIDAYQGREAEEEEETEHAV